MQLKMKLTRFFTIVNVQDNTTRFKSDNLVVRNPFITILTTTLMSMVIMLCGACTSSPKKTIFDSSNPTMASILQTGHQSDFVFPKHSVSKSEALAHNGSAHAGVNVFTELENPTLFLYIEPHVTSAGTYIAGMVVPYKLYDTVEFALPGER